MLSLGKAGRERGPFRDHFCSANIRISRVSIANGTMAFMFSNVVSTLAAFHEDVASYRKIAL